MPFKKGNTYSKGRGRGLGNRSSEDLHQSTTSRLLLHQDVDQTAAQAKPWKPPSSVYRTSEHVFGFGRELLEVTRAAASTFAVYIALFECHLTTR